MDFVGPDWTLLTSNRVENFNPITFLVNEIVPYKPCFSVPLKYKMITYLVQCNAVLAENFTFNRNFRLILPFFHEPYERRSLKKESVAVKFGANTVKNVGKEGWRSLASIINWNTGAGNTREFSISHGIP